jgi:5-methyltetrahydrofolate--homocysteine methyltransferase
MAIQAGLDAAILDPTDKRMMSNVAAAGALLGTDEYCTSYIQAFRAGRLL